MILYKIFLILYKYEACFVQVRVIVTVLNTDLSLVRALQCAAYLLAEAG